MQTSNIFREVTPLSEEDCFVIFKRTKTEFTYPVHIHPECELNFIENGKGAQRVVGDSIEEIDDLELCLIANDSLEHAWMNYKCQSKEIREITIQFQKDLLLKSLLSKKQFHTIDIMLENAKKGLVFSKPAIEKIKLSLYSLNSIQDGFYSVIELFKILHELSLDEDSRILSSSYFVNKDDSSESRRVQKMINYMHENYRKDIHLSDVAAYVNMSEVSFSRFMKKEQVKTI